MITPITKDYFYKCIGNVKNWKKIFGVDLVKKDSPWFDTSMTSIIYFEYLGSGYFVYLPAFNVVVIPDQYNFTISGKETIVLDNKVDDEYVRLCESIAINKDLDKSNFKIVFTPNHGTSYVPYPDMAVPCCGE